MLCLNVRVSEPLHVCEPEFAEPAQWRVPRLLVNKLEQRWAWELQDGGLGKNSYLPGTVFRMPNGPKNFVCLN